jgi:excisionase family DNA binding protein
MVEHEQLRDVVRVVDDGIQLGWPMVDLLGHGRLRRVIERDLRNVGGSMPAVLVHLLDTLDAASRSVVSDALRCCVEPPSEYERMRQLESISVSDAAELLGIGHEAVRMRIRRGSLHAWQDDAGRWRIPLELNRWTSNVAK